MNTLNEHERLLKIQAELDNDEISGTWPNINLDLDVDVITIIDKIANEHSVSRNAAMIYLIERSIEHG